MFVCEKNGKCIDCPIYDKNAEPCGHMVEVNLVNHGKWIMVKPRRNGRNATYKCTVCNKLRSSYYNDVQDWEYCPCGAKMDLGYIERDT